jgi:hypothetical protein
MNESRVADELEIRNLVARYSDAVLRLDSETWLETWAQEGEWELLGERSRGHEALAARLEALTGGLEYVMQSTGGGIVEIDGKGARGRWTVTEHARTQAGTGLFTMGAYSDEYCQEQGAWRFARRHFSLFYMGPPDLSGRLTPVSGDLGPGLEMKA